MDSQVAELLGYRADIVASSLEGFLSAFLDIEPLSLSIENISFSAEDDPPEFLPTSGMLISHQVALTKIPSEPFVLDWFVNEQLMKLIDGDQEGTANRDDFVSDIAEMLASSEEYTLSEHTAHPGDDLWGAHQGNAQNADCYWTGFTITMPDQPTQTLWLAWPAPFLHLLFKIQPEGPADTQDAVAAEEVAEPPVVTEPKSKHSGGALRLLRTQVPIIVTLAQKELPASKLFDLGPGTIIEFERRCDQPLVLSVNNLPVGIGEAVKIGDHFGLKVTGILSVQDRAARIGGKWKFG